MKVMFSSATSLVLAMSLNVGLPAPAQASSINTDFVLEFCADITPVLQDEFPDMKFTFGRCVSYFNANDVAGLCKRLKDGEALEAAGFSNQGDCVSTLRQLD
jgi:hypothetical protein